MVTLNPFSGSTGNFKSAVAWVAEVLTEIVYAAAPISSVKQLDATAAINGTTSPLISTDPPYYDNVGYADLSDFFYVWLRHSLRKIYPDLFSTLLTPKAQELVAASYRFGGDKAKAQHFFEEGSGKAFSLIRAVQNPAFPLAVYYAFKQEDFQDNGNATSTQTPVTVSTGWETMLEGLLKAGFAITGTWPVRTERGGRSVSINANALASSIVLACRPRPENAPITSRRDFLRALGRELPAELKVLTSGRVAPVDLAWLSSRAIPR